MSLKCVTLEVTGALIALRTSVAAIYINALKRYGVPVPPVDVLKKAYTAAFVKVEKDYPNWGNTALPDYKDWWKKAVAATFDEAKITLPEGAFPYIFQSLYNEFGVPSSWMAYEDGFEFIAWARKQGLLIGGNCVGYGRYTDGILPMLGLSPHLDFVLVSKNIGVQKPNPAAFESARVEATKVAKILNGKREDGIILRAKPGVEVKFDEILHIGDNVKKDYLAAGKLQMKTLLLDRQGEWDKKKEEGVNPDTIVRSLKDVPAWIQKNKLL